MSVTYCEFVCVCSLRRTALHAVRLRLLSSVAYPVILFVCFWRYRPQWAMVS